MPFFRSRLLYHLFQAAVRLQAQLSELAPLEPADTQYKLRGISETPHLEPVAFSLMLARQNENTVARSWGFPDIEIIVNGLRKSRSEVHGAHGTASRFQRQKKVP